MLVSVIVRTKDQAARLRLVLLSLYRQTLPFVAAGSIVPAGQTAAELIVVDDGSTDNTPAVLDEMSLLFPMRVVRHARCRGLAAAANAGARVAAGDVLLFMDGDTLASPRLAERHADRHRAAHVMARGETYHLRCTRFFLDPETGTPQPGQEERVARLGADLARLVVTRQQVLNDFASIERRAQPGIYPGAGPAALFALEWDALQNHPQLGILWMAAAGHNLSVRRHDFETAGGFDERLAINEHRELAFRFYERGVRLVPVPGAPSYHLTHRAGWRDPLAETEWEQIFYDRHPCQAVKLMAVFWMSIAGSKELPVEARIQSLPQFDAIVQAGTTIDYDSIRARMTLAHSAPFGDGGDVRLDRRTTPFGDGES
jgi:glycosyltransferase involved in cell wall biosynthesis